MSDDGLVGRIRDLLGSESARSFAHRAGISDSTLRSILSGARPNVDNLVAIADTAGVSLDWLAKGLGPQRRTQEESGGEGDLDAGDAGRGAGEVARKALSGGERFVAAGQLDGEFVLLPRYEVRAAAGGGAIVYSEQVVDHLAFKTSWVRDTLRRAPTNLILIEAMGDSMEPTISSGDLLLVDVSEERVRDNSIYVISVNGDLMVKRIQRRMTGELVVMSDNDRYPPDTLPSSLADQLRVVGLVVWHGGLV